MIEEEKERDKRTGHAWACYRRIGWRIHPGQTVQEPAVRVNCSNSLLQRPMESQHPRHIQPLWFQSESVSDSQTSWTNPRTRGEQMHNSIHMGPQLAFLYISIVVICTFHFFYLLLFFFFFYRLDRETEKYGEGRARKGDRERVHKLWVNHCQEDRLKGESTSPYTHAIKTSQSLRSVSWL